MRARGAKMASYFSPLLFGECVGLWWPSVKVNAHYVIWATRGLSLKTITMMMSWSALGLQGVSSKSNNLLIFWSILNTVLQFLSTQFWFGSIQVLFQRAKTLYSPDLSGKTAEDKGKYYISRKTESLLSWFGDILSFSLTYALLPLFASGNTS